MALIFKTIMKLFILVVAAAQLCSGLDSIAPRRSQLSRQSNLYSREAIRGLVRRGNQPSTERSRSPPISRATTPPPSLKRASSGSVPAPPSTQITRTHSSPDLTTKKQAKKYNKLNPGGLERAKSIGKPLSTSPRGSSISPFATPSRTPSSSRAGTSLGIQDPSSSRQNPALSGALSRTSSVSSAPSQDILASQETQRSTGREGRKHTILQTTGILSTGGGLLSTEFDTPRGSLDRGRLGPFQTTGMFQPTQRPVNRFEGMNISMRQPSPPPPARGTNGRGNQNDRPTENPPGARPNGSPQENANPTTSPRQSRTWSDTIFRGMGAQAFYGESNPGAVNNFAANALAGAVTVGGVAIGAASFPGHAIAGPIVVGAGVAGAIGANVHGHLNNVNNHANANLLDTQQLRERGRQVGQQFRNGVAAPVRAVTPAIRTISTSLRAVSSVPADMHQMSQMQR